MDCDAIISAVEEGRGDELASTLPNPRGANASEVLMEQCGSGRLASKLEASLSPERPNVLCLAQTLANAKIEVEPNAKALLAAPRDDLSKVFRKTFGHPFFYANGEDEVMMASLFRAWNLAEPQTHWRLSWRSDPAGVKLADRHYNRQSIGSKTFGPPGRALALVTLDGRALWVSSWQYGAFTDHEYGGFGAIGEGGERVGFTAPWVNSTFRNEGALDERGNKILSSKLIEEAVAVTRWWWDRTGDNTPLGGMITFVDPSAVKDKRDPGFTYLKAGWSKAGKTGKGLLAFRAAKDMIAAQDPVQPAGSLDVEPFLARVASARQRLQEFARESRLTTKERDDVEDGIWRADKILSHYKVAL
jgi:hypothetical protein